MPRMGRSVLPDYPHHIIQRGHNRQVVFAEAVDFERYLETLRDFKDIYGVRVYARVRVGSGLAFCPEEYKPYFRNFLCLRKICRLLLPTPRLHQIV